MGAPLQRPISDRRLRARSRAEDLYHAGQWDESLRLTERYVDCATRIFAAYAVASRGWIVLARDGPAAAADVAESLVQYGRASGISEWLLRGLALQAAAHELGGNATAHAAAVEQLVERLPGSIVQADILPHLAATAASDEERELIRDALREHAGRSRWQPAIMATLDGRHADAARCYREIGSLPLEAAAHLLAAEAAASRRQPGEAATHARQALEFYERVQARFPIELAAALLRQSA
jgi:hypothetical protein